MSARHLSIFNHTIRARDKAKPTLSSYSDVTRSHALQPPNTLTLCWRPSILQYLQWTQDPVDCATSVRFFYDDEFIYIYVQRRSAFRYNSVIILSSHVLTAPQFKQHVRSAPLPHVLCLCLRDLQRPHQSRDNSAAVWSAIHNRWWNAVYIQYEEHS